MNQRSDTPDEGQLDKGTLLFVAGMVQILVRHGEAGVIEETLRRMAAAIPSEKKGLPLEEFEKHLRGEPSALDKPAPVSAIAPLQDDVPLKCAVVNGSIQFVIGQKVLAHATNICPGLYDAMKDRGLYHVTDPAAFAVEVAKVLNEESEDGSTRLTKMMDEAVEHAINWGAEGVEENV